MEVIFYLLMLLLGEEEKETCLGRRGSFWLSECGRRGSQVMLALSWSVQLGNAQVSKLSCVNPLPILHT